MSCRNHRYIYTWLTDLFASFENSRIDMNFCPSSCRCCGCRVDGWFGGCGNHWPFGVMGALDFEVQLSEDTVGKYLQWGITFVICSCNWCKHKETKFVSFFLYFFLLGPKFFNLSLPNFLKKTLEIPHSMWSWACTTPPWPWRRLRWRRRDRRCWPDRPRTASCRGRGGFWRSSPTGTDTAAASWKGPEKSQRKRCSNGWSIWLQLMPVGQKYLVEPFLGIQW